MASPLWRAGKRRLLEVFAQARVLERINTVASSGCVGDVDLPRGALVVQIAPCRAAPATTQSEHIS